MFQTIALFIYLAGRLNDEGPFLILCPLSVLSNWTEEMERYRADVAAILFFTSIKIFFLGGMWNMIKQHIVPICDFISSWETLTWGNVGRERIWWGEGPVDVIITIWQFEDQYSVNFAELKEKLSFSQWHGSNNMEKTIFSLELVQRPCRYSSNPLPFTQELTDRFTFALVRFQSPRTLSDCRTSWSLHVLNPSMKCNFPDTYTLPFGSALVFIYLFSWIQICSRSFLYNVCRWQGGESPYTARPKTRVTFSCAANYLWGIHLFLYSKNS